MKAKPIREELLEYVRDHGLLKKWEKAFALFQKDHRHPSLHTELLQPKWRGIYSFRVDKNYRALFFTDSAGEAEIFQITNHYR